MAADPRKRQKKLQRRAARSKEKRHALVCEKSSGLPGQLIAAASLPVTECLVAEQLFGTGIGPVVIVRELGNGSVAFANFLVDRYCLGVKNAMSGIVSRFAFQSRFRIPMEEKCDLRSISPATARHFVEDAVAYAGTFGFSPHKDYARARLLFGSIDPTQATETLECGHHGKPLFISGPFDTPARCARILATLEHVSGPGGYDFVASVGGVDGPLGISDGADFEDEDEDELE